MGGDQGFLELTQLLLQAFGEQLLVEAGGGGGLAGEWVSRRLGQGGGRKRPNKRSRRADNEI